MLKEWEPPLSTSILRKRVARTSWADAAAVERDTSVYLFHSALVS